MNEQNKKVPTVRFKGFTNDWEQRKLGEISTSFSGGTPSVKNKSYYGGKIPFIRSAEIHKNKTELFITESGLKNSSAKLIKKGTLLYALYGATSGEVDVSNIDGAINQAIMAIFLQKDNVSFIKYYLEKNKDKIIAKYLQGGQGNLSASIIKSVHINLPFTEEQLKISNLIKKVESLISLQQRKLEQFKQLKKALLQQLFVDKNNKQPNLRFKNFNGDWEQRKLGELIESLFQGINTAADKVEYSNNGLPIIQAKNITSGSLDFSGSRKLSVQKYSNYLDKYIPQKGDILFANIGTIGPNVILKDTRQFFIAWNILRIVPQKNINGEFLKITLDLLNSKHYFEKLLTGNATKFVNKNDMRNLPIFFSDPEEQNKISNLFKKLDFLITLQQQKLAKYQSIKKSLLQQMFI